jgi:hypothetical protein
MTVTGGDYLLKHSLGIIFMSQPISEVFAGLAEAFKQKIKIKIQKRHCAGLCL